MSALFSTNNKMLIGSVILMGLCSFGLWLNNKFRTNRKHSPRKPKRKNIISSEQELIHQTLIKPPNTIIATHHNFSLYLKVKDFYTLTNGEWLNDEVINFYLALLTDRNIKQLSISHNNNNNNNNSLRVLFMNSFFYTKLTQNGYNYKNVKRWTKIEKLKKKGIIGINNIFEIDKIIFPINISNMHWCCGCINIKYKRFELYDSMRSSLNNLFKIMRKYIIDEYNDKVANNNNNYINLSEWINCANHDRYPQQQNGNDCGVFTLKCAQSISDNLYPNFTQRDMPYFRQRIMIDIINGAIN